MRGMSKSRLQKKVLVNEIIDLDLFIKECIAETKEFKKAGAHRKNDWEQGWSGQGVYYANDEYNNLPYYFKKNTHFRIGNRAFEDLTGFTEVELLRLLQEHIFRSYLPLFKAKIIFEYGCGTGSNIQFLRTLFPEYDFFGSDWAESACNKLIANNIVADSHALVVDYFDSNTYAGAPDSFVAFTNASLEQTGNGYAPFMEYLIKNSMCCGGIHIEPIKELLDLTTPLNRQSFDYATRRSYLDGFISYLKLKNINIIEAKDYGIGSKYISGYQVVCWNKPVSA